MYLGRGVFRREVKHDGPVPSSTTGCLGTEGLLGRMVKDKRNLGRLFCQIKLVNNFLVEWAGAATHQSAD